ncbi:MAG: lysylphosphatidylglycerol synthase transmembrane domain-containing protein [Elusimicrobiales bacterium]|nr:lysylphosphatidylglycerol synthase transmembrane domain-containing protein [Elusimicrobiales bacterium]
MRKPLSIAAGAVVSLGFLYLAARNIDLGLVAGSFSRVDWRWLPVISGIYLLELFLRGVKWKLLLDPAGRPRVWDCFRIEAVGLALNNILPFRLGELARTGFAARFFSIPFLTVLSTIVVERILDTLALIGLFMAAAALGGGTASASAYSGFFWLALGGVTAAVAALVFAEEAMENAFLKRFLRRLPLIEKLLRQAALGARAFHKPRRAVELLLLSVFQWSLDAFNFWLAALAFGIGDVIGFTRAITVIFTTAAAASLPGVPGYFGNIEYAVARVASEWGLDMSTGVAYAGWMHVVGYAVVTVTGLFFLYGMGQSLGQVWRDFSGRGAAHAAGEKTK